MPFPPHEKYCRTAVHFHCALLKNKEKGIRRSESLFIVTEQRGISA
jgi:hypothetical protein